MLNGVNRNYEQLNREVSGFVKSDNNWKKLPSGDKGALAYGR